MTDASLPLGRTRAALSAEQRQHMLGLAVFGAVGLLLLALQAKLLSDPDTHWHITVGQWIMENRAFPWVDPFSHTFLGEPWIAKEWLSQVLLHGAFEAGGWRGVAFLTVLCAAGSVAALAAWLAARLRSTLAIAIGIVALMMAASMLLARPHVIALPLMVSWTLGLLSARERGTAPPWALLPVMVLWANAHAGFTIGFVIAFLIGLEAIRDSGRDWLRCGLGWAGFGLAAILASCLTPYGPGAYLVTVSLFGSGEPLPFIREWRPLDLDMMGLVMIGALVALVLALASQPWRNVFRIALVLVVGAMMIRYTRFGLLFAFVALPVAAGPIARRFPGLGVEAAAESLGWKPSTRSKHRPFQVRVPSPDRGEGPEEHCVLHANVSGIRPIGSAMIAFVLLWLAALALPQPSPSPATTPAAALQAARTAGLTGPVYNSYDFGGYLISQRVPTFIDGRTDQLFLGGFFADLEAKRAASSHEGFAALMQARGITWALIEPGSHARRHFSAMGWRLVHQDASALVFARP
jgi:hypothetical protein